MFMLNPKPELYRLNKSINKHILFIIRNMIMYDETVCELNSSQIKVMC